MDTILQAFLSWQFLFFCIAVGAAVFVIRQIVEYGMENWWPLKDWASANKEAKLWRDLILPVMPVVLGQVGAYVAKGYPFPEGFSSTSGRIVFGLVAGFSSGLIVKLYKSFLASKASEFAEKVSSVVKPAKPECNHESKTEDQATEESVRESINKVDRQSLWLDTAGGIVANIGRDKR